jgi:uncharacterized protein YqjF (DUF2071 family)
MSATNRDGWTEFRSVRVGGGLTFAGRYRPAGEEIETAAADTLERFLVERYRLYTADRRGRIFHADVQHDPWPLQRAEAELDVSGLPVDPAGEPRLRFSRSVDVLIWPLRSVGGGV